MQNYSTLFYYREEIWILWTKEQGEERLRNLQCLNNKSFSEELIAYFSWYDTGHIENDASNNSSLVACVFVTAVTFLPSHCLAKIRGFLPSRCLATIRVLFTEPLPSNNRGVLQSRCLATIRFFFTEPLPSNDNGTFNEPLPSNDRGDTQTQTAKWSHKPTLVFKIRNVLCMCELI
jgi:hypothetical protein